MDYNLIKCINVTTAVYINKFLNEQDVKSRIVPKPSSFGEGCGMSVRTDNITVNELKTLLVPLQKNPASFELYTYCEESGFEKAEIS